MISWWWLIPTLFLGAGVGFVLCGILMMGKNGYDQDGNDKRIP